MRIIVRQNDVVRVAVVSVLLATTSVSAFTPSKPQRSSLAVSNNRQVWSLRSALAPDENYSLSREEINPIIQLGQGEKEKLVNAYGIWCAVVSIILAPIWSAAMSVVSFINENNEEWDPHRSVFDSTGKMWAKSWLTLTNSFPTVTGDYEKIKEREGACLYVANHASWLDIPVLCTVLDPVFKFIAKGELRKVPCIGQQLEGGNHILIDRDDRRSQLRTFKDGITWLRKGVPIMAFPEGMRSQDGRLMEFKGGLFSMAAKTKVPIVPITISHAHAVMPCNALFPVQSGAGKLHVHVHEPIETDGLSEEELVELVRESFLSTLPTYQHPATVPQLEKLAAAENRRSISVASTLDEGQEVIETTV